MSVLLALQSAPMIVKLSDDPTPSTNLGDVILGAFGLTGVLVLIAVVLGAGFALVRLGWNRRHPPGMDRPPSVTPTAAEP